MYRIALSISLLLAACAMPERSPLFEPLMRNDVLLRPNGSPDTRATLQLYPNGRGSMTFQTAPDLPVAFEYLLRRDVLCIVASPAVSIAAACSRVTIAGTDVQFMDIEGGRVEQGRLIPRSR